MISVIVFLINKHKHAAHLGGMFLYRNKNYSYIARPRIDLSGSDAYEVRMAGIYQFASGLDA